MEDANRSGNTRKLYQLLRKCAGTENATAAHSIEKADGTVVSNVDEQMKCWADHFSNLLNAGSSEHSTISNEFLTDPHPPVDCSTEAPSIFEIRSAIKRLKNNKAAGEDCIPPEFYKVAADEIVADLHALFSKMWEVPIFKKGNKTLCSNYRGISYLISHSRFLKVLSCTASSL
jgi:hypothetical protein